MMDLCPFNLQRHQPCSIFFNETNDAFVKHVAKFFKLKVLSAFYRKLYRRLCVQHRKPLFHENFTSEVILSLRDGIIYSFVKLYDIPYNGN